MAIRYEDRSGPEDEQGTFLIAQHGDAIIATIKRDRNDDRTYYHWALLLPTSGGSFKTKGLRPLQDGAKDAVLKAFQQWCKHYGLVVRISREAKAPVKKNARGRTPMMPNTSKDHAANELL